MSSAKLLVSTKAFENPSKTHPIAEQPQSALQTPSRHFMSIGSFNTTLIPVIKMMFKFSTIFTIVQMVLFAVAVQPNSADSTNSTEMATDSYGCFDKGELWKDLGTNESIIQAYDEQWCKNNVGWEPFGLKVKNAAGHCLSCSFQLMNSQVNLCIRDHPIQHAFFWEWEITEVPDGQDGGFISHVSISTIILVSVFLGRF